MAFKTMFDIKSSFEYLEPWHYNMYKVTFWTVLDFVFTSTMNEGILSEFLSPFSGLSELVPAIVSSTTILIGLSAALRPHKSTVCFWWHETILWQFLSGSISSSGVLRLSKRVMLEVWGSMVLVPQAGLSDGDGVFTKVLVGSVGEWLWSWKLTLRKW